MHSATRNFRSLTSSFSSIQRVLFGLVLLILVPTALPLHQAAGEGPSHGLTGDTVAGALYVDGRRFTPGGDVNVKVVGWSQTRSGKTVELANSQVVTATSAVRFVDRRPWAGACGGGVPVRTGGTIPLTFPCLIVATVTAVNREIGRRAEAGITSGPDTYCPD